MRQIMADTETTGFDAKKHRIVEIGLVEYRDRRPTGRVWHTYLNPESAFDMGAQEVTGLTVEFLADKPTFNDVATSFLDFIRDAELIFHNAPFDVRFLNAELARVGPGTSIERWCTITDTLAMARRMYQGKRNSLDAICKRLGVDNENRTIHSALIDALILGDVYTRMTAGQEKMRLPEMEMQRAVLAMENLAPRPRVQVQPDELALHQAWVDKHSKID